MNKQYRVVWNESSGTWAVASEISTARGKRASLSIASLAVSSVFGLAMLTVSAPAWSQSQCSATGSVYECSGAITEGVVISGSGDITVNSNADIAPTGTPGTGINVQNTGPGSITVNQQSGGITAWNDPSAPWIFPENGAGIFAANTATGTDITINIGESAAVSGNVDGVHVENYGTGATSVNVAGYVSGSDGAGVVVYGDAATTDLTVTQDGGAISGSRNGISVQNTGSGATTVSVSGEVRATDDHGIYANNNSSTGAALTIEQDGGNILGAQSGIQADNDGNGTTNISLSGDVYGTAQGVQARNGADTTGLTITQTAGSVSGNFGIVAENEGIGATNIDVAGNVAAAYGTGINAMNGSAASDLTVTQHGGSIGGTFYGISANNSGTGATNVRVASYVTATDSIGIYAYGGANSTDLSVVQTGGTIAGNYGGISADNSGTGATTVSVAGDVAAANGYGVYAHTGPTGKDLTVTQDAGSSITGRYGIWASNDGSGATSVTVEGDIATTSDVGVYAYNNSATTTDLTVSQNGGSIVSGAEGIQVGNYGTGATSINVAGDIASRSEFGVHASNGATATELTVTQAAGTITGARAGIWLENSGTGATNVSVAGDVIGTTGQGIHATSYSDASTGLTITQNSGTISGLDFGILTQNLGSGATIISTAGDVSSTFNDGISAYNKSIATDLTVTQSAGTIAGGGGGIYTYNDGTGATTVSVAGDIVSTNGEGIYAYNNSSATNMTVAQVAGSITSEDAGIHASNWGSGATNVSVAGSVTSASSYGLRVEGGFETNGLTTTQSGGAIVGDSGVYTDNKGTGATNISIAGDVTGNSVYGFGLSAYNGDSATELTIVQSGGTVKGGGVGIQAENNGTGATNVQVAGDVIGTDGYGLYAYNTWSSTNDLNVTQSAGTIMGGMFGVYSDNFGTGGASINVAGDVRGDTYDGVRAYNNGTATNLTVTQSAGSITGGGDGIHAENHGTGATNISVAGSVVGTGNGISAYNDENATDLNITQSSGVITGGRGIDVSNGGTGATNISVAGEVTSIYGTAIQAYNGATATDLTVTQTGGAITGATGIYADNQGTGATRISVAGDVRGDIVHGIYAYNSRSATDLTVTQTSGTISGLPYGIS
ncbi:ESPR-type extended signal peptide-containing protein, partial [Uliginosibacterium sp. sgz301328]|uniref:ESPR-type extended signal peptide-containing protein n=1 Tax=Uliginosibacterium sp. sgz301328 TaxID=3243764 RepID=UPI00359F0917